ncbi:MAG: CHAT domain-containing protein [Calditrichaeota bacterium]|nr:MAG: CHAT domain-containing protein [Calditrichota bacterium]
MLSGKSNLETRAVQQLGILLWMDGNTAEAISYMESALKNERASRGNYKSLQNRLAVCSCYIDAGRMELAYQTASDILQDCRFFQFNEFVPQCFILMSVASSDERESAALADSAYYWANFYYQWPALFKANQLLIVEYNKSGAYNEALKKYRQGLTLLSNIQPKAGFRWYSEGLTLSLPEFFNEFINLLIRTRQADEAMIIADQYNTLLQHHTLQLNSAIFKNSDQLQIDRYIRLKEHLSILKRDWISLVSSTQRTTAVVDTQAIKKSFTLSFDSLLTFQTELASQNQNLFRFYFQNFTSPEKIKESMSDKESCISYYYTDDALYSWYSDRDSVLIHQAPFNSSVFAKQLAELYQTLEARESISTISHQLYQELIGPWKLKLAVKKRLKIVPFEKLYLLPFALLQNENDEFLGFQNTLSVHPSLSLAVLETPTEREIVATVPKRVYAFAKPLSPLIQSDLSYTPLLATSLGRYVAEPLIYLDSRATENKLKNSASAMDFLLLGSEIVFDSEYAPNTRILLTKDDLDDGKLSIGELIAMNELPKDVCLTNAQTQDPLKCSGLAVQLFSSLFHYQGTESLLFPLTSGDSFGSSLLLKRYFRALAEGDGAALALQKAQKYTYEVINPHPAAWAPFVTSSMAH